VAYDGREVLADVDLSIARGEMLAVVGPSGAGKTTLLRLLNGTVSPQRGSVYMDGVALTSCLPRRELRRVRSRVGFVHQDHSLVPTLRVAQNVIAGKLGRRGLWSSVRSMLWPSEEDLEQAFALLERVGIPEKLFLRTDTLSGGQQQRVAIARALFQEPDALLADEPVASVDPARARDLIVLLEEVAAERELTLVVSLHDLELAREFFPRTVGLREGRVAFDEPTADVGPERFAQLYRLDSGQDRG
jgi:phosphonate transport system ATP-binding protein